jgi:uncharacterized protein YndB with AHSA1/START domain
MATEVVHRTLSIERSYPAPPARVFAAFADPGTKRRWLVEGPGVEVDEFTLDFRVGGFERTRFRVGGGAPGRNDTLFLDIVDGERIVFAYALSAGEVSAAGARCSTGSATRCGEAPGVREMSVGSTCEEMLWVSPT